MNLIPPFLRRRSATPAPLRCIVATRKESADVRRKQDRVKRELEAYVSRQREAGEGAYEAVAIALADHVDTINARRARAA